MKIMFNVQHPAWVHQFHHILETEAAQGNEILTLVSEKDGDTALLKNYGIPYVLCSKSTGKNVIEKGFLFLGLTFRFLWEAWKFKPDIFIGRDSPMMAIAAWLTGKPHLIYEDTEVAKFALRICSRLSTKILTPRHLSDRSGPPTGAGGYLQGAVLPASLRLHAGRSEAAGRGLQPGRALSSGALRGLQRQPRHRHQGHVR